LTGNITYSLLIPCYNASAYFDLFIKHIEALNIVFDEIIFYDDASSDNTAQLILSKGYRLIQGNENKGPGFARNRLAEAATGDYIHFHDVDDEFHPNFLTWIKAKTTSSQADVILGHADWLDSATRTPQICWRYNEAEINVDTIGYFITHPLGVINVTYKRQAFLKVNGFDEKQRCWEDADLHVRLAAAGASFSVIDEILAYSIRHGNGISNDQKACWHCRLNFLNQYAQKYSDRINKDLLTGELKKVQNAFINIGDFKQLKNILIFNTKYRLGINIWKIRFLYYTSKVISADIVNKLLHLLRSI